MIRKDSVIASAWAGRWLPLREHFARPVPSWVHSWIRLEASMTQRLQDACGRAITVQVSDTGVMALLHQGERRFFTPYRARGGMREVILHTEGVPMLAARTVFTGHTPYTQEKVMQLGNRSLGSLLFAQGAPQCMVREYACVTPAMPLFALVEKACTFRPAFCWARRSLFLQEQTILLVTEIFLPALEFVGKLRKTGD